MSHPAPHTERLAAELLRPSLVQGLLLMLAACVAGAAYFVPSWTAQGLPFLSRPQGIPSTDAGDPQLQMRLDQAGELFQAQHWAKAAKAYREIVTDRPDVGVAWHRLAYALHVQGKLDEAIPCHEKSAAFERFKPVSLYNLACAFSLKKDKAKALGYLRQAIDAGFNGLDYLNTDTDLDFLRRDPAFEKMREKVKQRGGQSLNACPDCAQACPDQDYKPVN